MDFFDAIATVAGIALMPIGWYINALRERFKAVEDINREQSAKLAALELYIAKNHPDNADFQKLTDTVEKLIDAVNDLRADVRGLMSRG
jgi:hypothetical protein